MGKIKYCKQVAIQPALKIINARGKGKKATTNYLIKQFGHADAPRFSPKLFPKIFCTARYYEYLYIS